MDKEDYIQLNKELAKYNRDKSIKECFHFDNTHCSGKIISSHSIQNNKCLTLLVEMVEGNEGIYCFSKYTVTQDGEFQLSLIGRKTASTFSGFCAHHDQIVFESIDNNNFDFSVQQIFLYSYRAFAQSYHKNREELKGLSANTSLKERFDESVISEMIAGSEIACRDLEKYKLLFNKMLKENDYCQLDFFVYKKKGLYPVAASSSVNLSFTPYGVKNKFLSDIYAESLPMQIVVLPEPDYTYVILTCFKNDSFHRTFLNELRFNFANSVWVEKIISSLLVYEVENTCISPYILRKMEHKEKEQLCTEIVNSINLSCDYFERFRMSSINFFDSKFCKRT